MKILLLNLLKIIDMDTRASLSHFGVFFIFKHIQDTNPVNNKDTKIMSLTVCTAFLGLSKTCT